MRGINHVLLCGNIGDDPILRYTSSGVAVLNIRMATTRSWMVDKEIKEATEWHQVIVWGKQGEALEKFLSKGQSITVEGRLQTRSYEAKDGSKRYSTEIVASEVIAPKQGGAPSAPTKDYGPAPTNNDAGAGFGTDDIPF